MSQGPGAGPAQGRARCHGAVGVLNALATGHGCALAVEGGIEATWRWQDGPLVWQGPGDDRVARAVLAHVQDTRGVAAGARAATTAPWPPARGLKTSSGAAGALLHAALRGLGEAPSPTDLAREAVAVARRAGTTLTGAFDDQMAVLLGGCRFTDNLAMRDLGPVPVPAVHVAVWVPEAALPKPRLAGLDPSPILEEVRAAEALLRRGHVAEAMTRSGAAWARLTHGAGAMAPGTQAATAAAMAAGAMGAGMSGCGPAVAALFEDRVDLPDVAGGAWRWTRSTGGAP